MSTGTSITLYKNCRILKDENFILPAYNPTLTDSIYSYLLRLTKYTFTNIKFTKKKLDIEVIIQESKSEASIMKAYTDAYNYAMIQQADNSSYNYAFYFITKKEMISQNSIRLYLHLDVLNTFREDVHYKFSPLTHILRQHKSRFKTYTGGLYPHIDEYSEGIIPQLYNKESEVIKEVNSQYEENMSWYLVYITASSGTGIICYLIPETRIKIASLISDDYYNGLDSWILKDFDLTDNKLIKIIKLPYCPVNYEVVALSNVTGYGYLFDGDEWDIENSPTASAELRLKKKDVTEFMMQDDWIKDDIAKINPLCILNMSNTAYTKAKTDLRSNNINYDWEEPKLFHSDFYYWKYIYDSFTKVMKNESYFNEHRVATNGKVMSTIEFYVTSTINSTFMFKFAVNEYNFNDEDFASYLIVNRNNQVTIYSNDYLNYLKSGYNYDVKAKNQTESYSWIATGVGLAGGVASLVFGSKTLGVALISSSVMSIASSINNTISAERNLEQKVNQLKNQSASVYGSDDVDLMSVYNKNNKLWRAKYEVSPRMRKALKDLFFYTGYIDDTNEIPTHNNRIWFDFLQCDPHFTNTDIPEECLEELVNRFKGGVTYLHMNNLSGAITFDFDRKYENWEKEFFI